ncbi:MAG: hypothetical protein A2049_00110 [Elusimicrobia bacterium GWA2_62_23]|nr:MAG: hypothetical protein A2049_00110 [Elusimicrobia bacterium GWA2_62_23]OGR70594.1 MAG: hypothetical protein A2179_02680 [Elusimicrobia bacterium GWC2_63_65]
MASKVLLASLLALGAAALAPGSALAQMDRAASEQTFDYNPGAGETTPAIQQSIAETTYEDAELIEHPVYGTIMLSKSRWKNWVARAMYLTVINIALLVIILSFSKTEESNIIISYVLCGASLTVSFWVFLCAVLLANLKSAAWTYIGPVSLITGAAGYFMMLKVKKYDISLAELKESFQKLRAASHEDPRLSSVDGSPGDWPGDDFVR